MAGRLRRARAEMDAQVRLGLERSAEASGVAHDSGLGAVKDRIAPEGLPRGEHRPTGVKVAAAPLSPSSPEAGAGARLEAVLALVDRVEAFVRSGRPGLAFTVRGPWARRVELERAGPARVSLTLHGRRLAAPEERLLAAELGARGITLARRVG